MLLNKLKYTLPFNTNKKSECLKNFKNTERKLTYRKEVLINWFATIKILVI